MNDDILRKKIKFIELKSRKLVNELFSGEYHSVFKGQGINFSELREYISGDDVRFIDWNSSARYSKTFLKVFNEERQLNVTFIIDASASLKFSASSKSKLETAAEISALLAFAALKNNDKTGVILFTDEIEKFIPPKYGKKNALLIIREILAYKPAGKKTDIAKAIRFAIKSLKKKSTIFFISDFFDSNYCGELSQLQNKHDVIAVMLKDKIESNIENTGLIKWTDAETGETAVFDSGNKKNRDYFIYESKTLNESLKNSFNKSGVEYIEITDTDSYIQPLVKYFKNKRNRNEFH
ncbi:MAG TPA: DUF58 domain-containing protein [bacterium]|nr:DUF58 domain-containing protein [bacterium]